MSAKRYRDFHRETLAKKERDRRAAARAARWQIYPTWMLGGGRRAQPANSGPESEGIVHNPSLSPHQNNLATPPE